MAIADELIKLENNRAAIVTAINDNGGTLAENAGLSLCPDAINGLFGGSTPPPTNWTGHVDEDGLRYIGWNDEDIETLKTVICWDEADDDLYAVPQNHKDLWDACEKVTVDGRTMLDGESGIASINAIGAAIKYIPMVDTSKLTQPFKADYKYYNLIAMPNLDLGSVTSMFNAFANCKYLRYLDLNLPKCENLSYMLSGTAPNMAFIRVNAPIAYSADFLLNGCCADKCELTLPIVSSASRLLRAFRGRQIHLSLGDKVSNCERCFDSIASSVVIVLENAQFTNVNASNYLPAPGTYKIPFATASNFKSVKSWLESMLRGVPNYTADSYPMFFETDSSVTDDADGTLKTLVDQCTNMKWAIANLSIIPYSA